VFTCIEAPLEELAQDIKTVFDSFQLHNWRMHRGVFRPEGIFYPAPPIGGGRLLRFAVWNPANRSPGSVFMANSMDGMQSFVRNLNRICLRKCVRVFVSNDYESFPACLFEYLSCDQTARVVQVTYDEGWQFYESGKLLPIESR